jgi:NDP-sugar pyrophosphorylase family protein
VIKMLQPSDFFDLSDPLVKSLFENCDYVWQALANQERNIERLVKNSHTVLGQVMDGAYISDRAIYIEHGARIEPGAYVLGPAYIGRDAVVRHGALVRENVIMMAGSVLGHASEAKNSIMLPRAHAPHFNYIGDSILGADANLGAGTKLSNLTMMSIKDPKTGLRPTLQIGIGERLYDTGLAKLGSILGDDVQTGCNAVLNPGCLIGPRTLIYANVSLRKGYYEPDCVQKLRQAIEGYNRR